MQSEGWSGNQEERSFVEAARRAQIVEAAIETIAEVGYAKASFTRIAARAGISASLISYHFAGKQELIQQIHHDVNDAMDRALEQRAEGADGYTAALRALIEGFVHYCADHRSQMLALGRIEDSLGREPSDDAGLGELEEMLREGQQAGEFRNFSPRLMAVTLSAAWEAVPAELFTRPDTDVGTYADELATTFELAVRAHAVKGNGL